jgi:hypothetical protein
LTALCVVVVAVAAVKVHTRPVSVRLAAVTVVRQAQTGRVAQQALTRVQVVAVHHLTQVTQTAAQAVAA